MGEITLVVAERERKEPGVFGEQGAYARAYGLENGAYAAGTLVGPLWGGLLVQRVGWEDMVLSLGILCAFTAALAGVFAGGPVGKVTGRRGEDGESVV